jgi:hypothetical protein
MARLWQYPMLDHICCYRYTNFLDEPHTASVTEENIELGVEHAINDRRAAYAVVIILCGYDCTCK